MAINTLGGIDLFESEFKKVIIPIPKNGIDGFLEDHDMTVVIEHMSLIGDHIETAAIKADRRPKGARLAHKVYIFSIPSVNYSGTPDCYGYMRIRCLSPKEFREEFPCSELAVNKREYW